MCLTRSSAVRFSHSADEGSSHTLPMLSVSEELSVEVITVSSCVNILEELSVGGITVSSYLNIPVGVKSISRASAISFKNLISNLLMSLPLRGYWGKLDSWSINLAKMEHKTHRGE